MTDSRVDIIKQASAGADVEANRLLRTLDSTRIVVRASPAHAAAALSFVNLIARLFSAVDVEALPSATATVAPFGSGPIRALATSVVADVRAVTRTKTRATYLVDIGVGAPGADLYLWSDGWSLSISPSVLSCDRPPRTGPADVAVGALAAGEVLRTVVPQMPGVRLAGPRQWNLIDYRAETTVVAVPHDVDVRAVLFGAGSVGSSFLYSLLLSDSRGRITAVDRDTLHRRNKIRYPLWIRSARGPKVGWLAGMSTACLEVKPARMTASEWIAAADAPELAIAAVDNTGARRDIVDLLAKTTLNAGVDGLKLHCSRHHLGDGCACVYCPYLDAGDPMDEVDIYVELTGLAPARVAQLLGGDTLSDKDVASLISADKLEPTDRDLVGGRIVDLARHRLYARAAARLGATTVAISTPYVSALAGALLAAEAIKTSAGGLHAVDRRVDVDTSGYPTGFTSRPQADATGKCLCQSPVRLRLYGERWAGAQLR